MLRKIIAVIAGLFCCLALNAIVVQFSLRFTDMKQFADPAYIQQLNNGTAEIDPLIALSRYAWLSQYIYFPLIVFITTIFVSLIDRKTPFITGGLATSPILALPLIIRSGRLLENGALFLGYLIIVLVTSYLLSRALRPKKYSEQPPTIEEMNSFTYGS
jgi:hypothetical protein